MFFNLTNAFIDCMKLSDFNITEGLHTRWCRFMIQRYLGQFLEQNLTLDQLSVKLIDGELSINEVKINSHYVNELLTSMNVPLRLTDGFVGGMTIKVPWCALTSDASTMKVRQLDLTFEARDGVKLDNKDLVSSMIGSVVESLVSSSELARSFYENEKEACEEEFDTEAKDGVKAFTKVIDAIVSRFCLELVDTTIRLENPPKHLSDMCTAIEIRIKEVRFMDEQMRNCQQEGRSAETITSQPQGMGSIANLNKFMDMSGVEIFTDVFTELEDQYSDNNSSQIVTSMYIRREKQKHKSPSLTNQESISPELFTSALSSSTSNFHSCYSNLNAGESLNLSIGEPFRITRVDSDRELISTPVKFAEFTGESTLVILKGSPIDRFNDSPAFTETIDISSKSISDYDAMAKNIEEEALHKTRLTTLGMQGTWSRRDDFHEFDSVNLEDNRSLRKLSEACHNYNSIKTDSSKKECTLLSAKIGTILVFIPHNDIMSVEYVKTLSNGCHEAIDQLVEESEEFFAKAAKVSLKPMNLHNARSMLDKLYSKDHLRIVGTSVVFNYQMDKSSTSEQMKAKLIFPNLDVIEYLTPESNPREPQNPHIPLVDFSNYENPDQEPQLKLVFSSPVGGEDSKAYVYLGKCRCELDLSIVDRIADLFEPRPFYDLPSYKRSRLDSIVRKDALQLRDDLFGIPLVVEQPSKLMVVLKCQAIDLNLRIPIADLRNPSGSRLPYRQRHVHPEYIGLHISSVTVEMPIGGESTLMELFATEIYGSFCGVSEKFSCSDEDRRFLWGGQTSVDEPVHVKFEYDPRNKALKASSTKIHYVNDLLLWQPAAPSVRPGDDEFKINALSDDMFHECGGDPVDRYEDECEEERFTSSQANGYDKNKSHSLSLLLNVKKGTMLMCTGADESGDQSDMGQVSIELSDAQLFTVTGYHGRISDTYFYFTTHTVGVGHKNACSMPRVVNQADFGKWSRDDTQMDSVPSTDEFSSQTTDDAVGVAIYLCERLGQNIKDVLLAIAVRNTCVQLRPFRSSKETWMFQLAELFALQDYPIPGYELPVVTTDLHIHLDNVVLAYDHVWTNPESDIRLRLVLRESDISSSIIQDMNAVKVVSIFEGARLYMSNAKKSKDNILSSFFPVTENSTITAPVLEIRCRNDIIKVWVCVDSFVVLLNLASEISRSEKFAPPEPKEASVRSVDSCEDNANSECEGYTKKVFHSSLRMLKGAMHRLLPVKEIGNLPKPVEMKMKRMLASAMQEDSSSDGSSAGIPCGREALEEFSPNFSLNQNLLAKALVDTAHSERNRAYSLSTDDEFCMVDEDVIGSGITNATGEPNIKYIGSRNDRTTSNAGITIDPHHFRVPSDWRGDGLAALPTDFPSPVARYLLRDISVSIHLFGGSDLSDEPPKERSYSTPEYREGKGKNQVVSPDARGGKYRDHSVCVVLELKKITCIFQQFNKDAPLMSMKLFTIHDITLFDRLTASQIKEMMYQYSSAEQPRRTCAPMLAVRMVESHKNEGKLRVSMLPVKFNIDQDTMEFLDDFFQEVRTRVEIPTGVSAAVAPRPVLEVPATIRSSSDTGSVKNSPIYPALSQDTPLNMDVLMPEAAPPSPIYDLSYLENRTKSTSPIKRSTVDAPLTASAVSIGNLFGTKSRASQRLTPLGEPSSQAASPDFNESSSPDLLQAPSTDDKVLTDDLAGDWSSSSEIRFPDMDHIGPVSEVDKMLMGASMHDSFHPDMMPTGDDKARDDFLVSDDLIDTSGEIDACLNGGDG
ncbi:hypothetical protein COOONC_01874, partial [Cooperia oncophora]